jgi:dipeptidyl aminopeptidase/acylaminoacyl peptidase
MRNILLTSLALGLASCAARAEELSLPSVEHAIAMERIEWGSAAESAVAAISPDGTRYAVVTWHGDLARDTNVYSLRVGVLSNTRAPSEPTVVLTRDFAGDPEDQSASPISDVRFLDDNRTIAYLGREGSAPAQVFTVDSVTREVRQLTRLPRTVTSFVIGPDLRLRAFSAPSPAESDAESRAKLATDGVFLWDSSVYSWHPRFLSASTAVGVPTSRQVRRYYVVDDSGDTEHAHLVYDSREARLVAPVAAAARDSRAPSGTLEEEMTISGWSTLTGDPQGRYALLFPYARGNHPMQAERYAYYEKENDYARRVAAPYGLLDLRSGKIERLIDAPHPQFEYREGGPPVWSPDGRTVIVYSLLPLGADAGPTIAPNTGRAASPNAAPTAAPDAASKAARQLPTWLEVDIATRAYKRVPVPAKWHVVRWMADGHTLLLSSDRSFGALARRADGSWAPFKKLGTVAAFDRQYSYPASNGRVVLGVRSTLTTPPELVSCDVRTGRTTALTNLNPVLRRLQYGAIQAYGDESFLIRPIGYRAGQRYPLVVLLDDGTLGHEGEPFIFDGVMQLSGHAAQMLAARGFMVAYLREPKSIRDVVETPAEGEAIRTEVEALIAHLDRDGLIDSARVGISGWSRAGYYVDSLLIHSNFRFAAATQIDGGGAEYNEGMRPFTDAELAHIRAPLLFEPHGLRSMVWFGPMADRLDALGKPTEILYFPTASHSTTRPKQRYRSLTTHIDWWRFWLENEEDPDPAKAAQYANWRKLRERDSRP